VIRVANRRFVLRDGVVALVTRTHLAWGLGRIVSRIEWSRTGGVLKSFKLVDPVWAGVVGRPRNWYGYGTALK
jgi:hypothetical protein